MPAYLPSIISLPNSDEPSDQPTAVDLQELINEDEQWLSNCDHPSWELFHSKRIKEEKVHANLSGMLPIWRYSSKSPSTIKHSLKVIKKAVNYLNPCQTSVIAFDQPLFEISKKIQWHYSEYGMSKIVIMMGSLHIEMAMMSTIGDWLEDSGWTIALSNAKVNSPGNQSLLTGHDVA